MKTDAPFEPTVCSCKLDQQNCRRQPGHLLPGQLEEIAEYLNKTLEEIRELFWASPGMVLRRQEDHRNVRLRTITPKIKHDKCVFYRQGMCTIHEVAPFGCRFFDAHMSAAEGQKRAMWGVNQILTQLEEYEAQRDQLDEATSWRPKSY